MAIAIELKNPNNPNNQTTTEAETVQPTDVSLVCDDPSRHKNSPKTYQTRISVATGIWLNLLFLLAMASTLFGHSKQEAGELVVEGRLLWLSAVSARCCISLPASKFYIKSTVDAPLHAGTYEVPANASFKQLMDAFKEGQKVDMVSIQIIEGKTAADLYKVIANAEGVELEVLESNGKPKANFKQLLGIDAFTPEGEFVSNLEGWFTPDTYHYARGVTDKQILNDLYKVNNKL